MTDRSYMVNKFDESTTSSLEPSLRALVERRSRVLGSAYKLFYDHPVAFVRAEGVHLYDAKGEAYLDAYNNVPSVGHCHPHVVEAIARQAARLNTHTRYATEELLDYSERLLSTMPDSLSNMMYTCSGSEAVDLALRVASSASGGTGVVVTSNAYHGTTSAAAAISPNLGPGVPIGTHVRLVSPPQPGSDPATVGADLAQDVHDAIVDLERHGVPFSAFVADSLFSTDGVRADPAGFLRPVVDVVHEAGGLYVADEVQPGFGRTGATMWGFQRHGIVPDLVVMGKPMGNGMPIAGVASRPDVFGPFGASARYFNTFAGNSVCVAAANAVLDVLEDEGLMDNARVVGNYLRDALASLARAHGELGDVRGAGLYLGVDVVSPSSGLPDPRRAMAIVNALRERRVLISATGAEGHVLKIRPPLPFSEENADELLGALGDVLNATT